MARRQTRELGSHDIGRISSFSDAVFAIALTLPVLELKLPSDGATVLSQLSGLLPAFGAYLITFAVGSSQWLAHYRLFESVAGLDNASLTRNLLYLFLFSLLPFSTALVMRHGNETLAVILYDLNLAALGFVMAWMTARLVRAGFVRDEASERIRTGRRRSIAVGLTFMAAALLALYRPLWAVWVPALTPLALFLAQARFWDSRTRA